MDNQQGEIKYIHMIQDSDEYKFYDALASALNSDSFKGLHIEIQYQTCYASYGVVNSALIIGRARE